MDESELKRMHVELNCESLEATRQLGRRLGAALKPGVVIALFGPLGAGKTTLVRAVTEGAGVTDLRQVNSPTFVIVNEYETAGRLRIHHVDAYRLRGGGDLEALGFEEMPETGAVLIEWADRVADLLLADHLAVTLTPTGPESRRVRLEAHGATSATLLSSVTRS
jgi:tRNA threonylcarbamoyl adenosine modification protein YjeE